MAFRDYCKELEGSIPLLPYMLARTYINRAWSDIRGARDWSWKRRSTDVIIPALVNAGTVTVTFGSATITPDAAALVALNALAGANPPLASATLGLGRQFRLPGGPIYSILNFAGGVLTLDRAYTEDSGAGKAYQIYRCYIAAPALDFSYYTSLVNVRAGYAVRNPVMLNYPQDKLNVRDPKRSGSGDVYALSPFKSSATGQLAHETYNHCMSASVLNLYYYGAGTDLSDTVDLPSSIPSSLLMARAMSYGAVWAMANVGKHAELQGTNWVLVKADRDKEYKLQLRDSFKTDDDLAPPIPIIQNVRRWMDDLPWAGEYAQTHALPLY